MKNSTFFSKITLAILLCISFIQTMRAQSQWLGQYNVSYNNAPIPMNVSIQSAGNQYLVHVNTQDKTEKVIMETSNAMLMGLDNAGVLCMIGYYNGQLVLQIGALYTLVLQKVQPVAPPKPVISASVTVANTTTITHQTVKPQPNIKMSPMYHKLKNKQLLYMYTNNGYTTKSSYFLYEDGTYSTTYNQGYSSGGFSAAGAGRGNGHWTVQEAAAGTVITLDNNYHVLNKYSSDGHTGTIYLDKKRYFIVDLNYR